MSGKAVSGNFRSADHPDHCRSGPLESPHQSLVKSGVEKQLATPDHRRSPSRPGASAVSHPDGNRLAVSFVRQHGKIYMLQGFDESTSWLIDRDQPLERGLAASDTRQD
jgi:hypothetical protein